MKNSATGYIKKERGITIIVLIITIVIMLILLGVSTKVVIDGKLFNTAQNAVDMTNNKIAKEDTRVGELMDELENTIQSQCEHEWGDEIVTRVATCLETGEKTKTCIKCGKVETTVIKKIPHNFENGSCTICQQKLVLGAYLKGYDPSKGENGETINTSYTSPAIQTGHNKDQTFTVTSITDWRVLAEIDGQILITTDKYIAADNETRYCLKGKQGYINGIEELHKVCSIYGQGKYADKTKYTVNIGNETINTGGRSIKQADGRRRTNRYFYRNSSSL